jgi:hypothetical protein
LILDREVANRDGILGDIAAQLTGAIADLKGRAVLRVCR